MSAPKKTEDDRRRVTISFLLPVAMVREIDKRCAQLQAEKIAKVHRSDVIKGILAKDLGMDLRALEGEEE